MNKSGGVVAEAPQPPANGWDASGVEDIAYHCANPAKVCLAFKRSARKLTAMNDSDDSDWIPREREESLCPCKSRSSYATCCMPFHHGKAKPETAEQLMRSRFSAYFFRLVDYLVETTHPSTREPGLKRKLEKTIYGANWSFLTIVNVTKGGKDDKVGKIEFIADYFVNGEAHELHERSRFKRFKGGWKYLDGKEA